MILCYVRCSCRNVISYVSKTTSLRSPLPQLVVERVAASCARNRLVECLKLGSNACDSSVRHYMQQGKLVPDEVILEIVERCLNQPDCAMEFLLDGFPRNLSQAGGLQGYLDSRRLKLTAAVESKSKPRNCSADWPPADGRQ